MALEPGELARVSDAQLAQLEAEGKIWRVTPQRALADAQRSGKRETERFWRDEIDLLRRLQADSEFWADAVVRLKREQRYNEAAIVCRQAMPVPAAYQHLLICLRKLYRKGKDNRRLLLELYAYAVEYDVLHRVPYVEYDTSRGRRGCPGFNVASIVWAWLRERPIALSYRDVGYTNVQTLLKTDRMRLVDELGEPASHRDPFGLIKPLWERGVQEMAARERERDRESEEEWRRLLGLKPTASRKWSWLFRLVRQL